MILIKECENCKEIKEHYAKGFCKKCYDKEWFNNNPAKTKQYHKKYYKNNPDIFKQCNKRYRQNNKEKVLERKRRYNKLNRHINKIASKRWKNKPENKIKQSSHTHAFRHKQRENECTVCETSKDLLFHHTNYEKREGVTVCRSCHYAIHN